ncbi:thermonuclease family protein (plasmid) [Thermomicrobium sp. 4228-Ro]|uniref:thermonuclease family protein n=1 Tax=Thermomicrobium sp. 4228-Ro TaxID=2993937 RepID=UPI002248B720|nr:thermonuclease family protein [Thermomicrobium sp. 4228-Ro]MCX2728525.1 thermonuclease family protein [Thermomicrobium sp. 4228-Ro]
MDTWARSDLPVAAGRVSRTWMWGPEPFTTPLREAYADAPGGTRLVQYFDKSRMEITDPAADRSSPWYVTNGLLAKELVTGQLQRGDATFEPQPPAQVNVAGDPDDPDGPTYASFSGLLDHAPLPVGTTITQTVDRAGNVGSDLSLGQYGVTAVYYVPETNHTVASVFWDFMNSRGQVYVGWRYREDALFPNPFYATGFPLTEAYWARVRVAGVQQWVLVQVFERRVLTYTPGNPEGWKVEAGNVGQHYYRWRYQQLGQRSQEASVYQLATVTNVVDGDTIDVDLGGQTVRVRLIGVDTPEVYGTVECYGRAASDFTRSWLLGKQVGLEKDVSETDRYGRVLRYVWIGPYLFNELLVRQGYAGVATYPPDVKYTWRFVEAERVAREERAGLWGACPVSPVGGGQEPAPAPQPTPSPPPATTPTPKPNCDPSYPTVCIPPPPPDLDCSDIPYRRFKVLPPDPHRFDRDRDGIGCESG